MSRVVVTRRKTYIPVSWIKYGAVGVAVAMVAWWPQESRSKSTPTVQPLQLTGADLATDHRLPIERLRLPRHTGG